MQRGLNCTKKIWPHTNTLPSWTIDTRDNGVMLSCCLCEILPPSACTADIKNHQSRKFFFQTKLYPIRLRDALLHTLAIIWITLAFLSAGSSLAILPSQRTTAHSIFFPFRTILCSIWTSEGWLPTSSKSIFLTTYFTSGQNRDHSNCQRMELALNHSTKLLSSY